MNLIFQRGNSVQHIINVGEQQNVYLKNKVFNISPILHTTPRHSVLTTREKVVNASRGKFTPSIINPFLILLVRGKDTVAANLFFKKNTGFTPPEFRKQYHAS
jgi:hypothetical protein